MLAEYPSQGNLKGINKLKMKEKIIEELRNKFFMDCTNMNDETPKVDIAPHDLFEWIKRNIIDQPQEPKQSEVSEELQYQNLTCLVNGFELNLYQKALAKQEYEKLLSMKQTNK